MDVALIAGLILLNGLFAMSEIALVSAKKFRLEQAASAGHRGAQAALALAGAPSRLLSTLQIGITLVTLAQGAFAESVFKERLSAWLAGWPALAPVADEVAMATVLVVIGAASLVFGELVPKRIALIYPEAIAKVVAPVMLALARATDPFVRALSTVTEFLVRPFGRHRTEPPVTEEDIRGLLEQGASAGVFEADETRIANRVFKLDDQTVGRIMTPRADMVVIDLEAEPAEIEALLKQSDFTLYPVVRGDVANVVGVIDSGDLLAHYLKSGRLMPERVRRDPVFVPETISVLALLETFKRTRVNMAFVVDEHGEVLGLVTLKDVLEAIVGDLGEEDEPADSDAVARADGSWLVDGAMSLERFHEVFAAAPPFPGEAEAAYHTLGGFMMTELGRLARVGDLVWHRGWRFEVLDLDGKRIDKLLVTPPPKPPDAPS
ncbi:MAG: hemolysin family protein [Casimicrobiaceae bacterium]|nr:hemolysin family protein [Casimicrobiaceae bacterium]